jgi:predicted metal-dependent hydrolase
VDLLHAGCLWEAHEAWEGLWRAAVPGSAMAHGLRGLIQGAAAGVKARGARLAGARGLAAKACQELAQAGAVLELGAWRLDLARWRRELAAWAAHLAEPGSRPEPPPLPRLRVEPVGP